MPVQSRSVIKTWFETGDFPTQQQFWDWIDSVLWAGEVQITDIVNLLDALQAKADKAALDAFEQGDRVAFEGDGYYDIPQNYLLEKVIVLYGADGSLKIGTTAGGEDILPELPWTVANVDPITIDKYAKVTRRIYFTGPTAGSVIIFLKRLIKQ